MKIKNLIKECILEVLEERLTENDIPTDMIMQSTRGEIYKAENARKIPHKDLSQMTLGQLQQYYNSVGKFDDSVFVPGHGWGGVKEDSTNRNAQTPVEKTKKDVYVKLSQLDFRPNGTTPRDYMEYYYYYNFATIQCIINDQINEVELYLFYDNETMAENNKSKKFKLPVEYSPELVTQIVNVCRKWKDSISKDEPVYGGMDDLPEGFDSSINTK